MNKGSATFFAFLSGAVVGSLLGVLYAPDKGSNTRDKLSYKLTKYREKLEQLISEYIENEEIMESLAKTQGAQVVDEAKKKAEKLLDDVDSLINQIKTDKNVIKN